MASAFGAPPQSFKMAAASLRLTGWGPDAGRWEGDMLMAGVGGPAMAPCMAPCMALAGL